MATTILKKPLPINEIKHVYKNDDPFPNMPILYLEFLENTDKVKKEFVGKDYVPPATTTTHVSSDAIPSDVENDDDDDDEILKAFRSDREIVKNDRDEPPEKVRRVGNSHDEHRQNSNETEVVVPVERPTPPSLAELRANNQAKTLKSSDYKYPQEDDDETIKKRNDVFFHYEVLKKMHPSATIPEFSVYSDPEVMAQKYEFLAKKLSLDSSVENWKRYMIIFVMGCEVGLGKLKFDMEGFAQQQISSMNTYDQLLVEMAEKSYVPSGNRWPVEVRLLMMLTMNVVLFVVSKMIFKKTGTNLLGSINEITGVKVPVPTAPDLKDP